MDIYRYLGLGELDCCVAIIKNARSNEMGRKDIIKIDGSLSEIDLDILGLIDTNITVNVIKDGINGKMSDLSDNTKQRLQNVMKALSNKSRANLIAFVF